MLTRKCIELAATGEPMALKLCMERIVPPRKELPVQFQLPPLNSGADLTAAMVAILKGVSEGKILLSQAMEFAKLLEMYGRTANFFGVDDFSNLTDEELRARILRAQAVASAVDVEWEEQGGKTDQVDVGSDPTETK